MLEALSHGLPVLASDINANKEIGMSEDQYFKLGNIDDLAAKIFREAETTVNEASRNAVRRWVCRKYNWEDIASSTLEVYRSVLQEGAVVEV